MTAPTRPTALLDPDVAPEPVLDATADVAAPRPVLMDRLSLAGAEAADVQRTLGNRIARQAANERLLTGETTQPEQRTPSPSKPASAAPTADDPKAPSIDAPPPPPIEPAPARRSSIGDVPAPQPAAGITTVAPPAPGPANTVADLQGQVARAANAIPRPAANAYSGGQQAIRAQGFRLARGTSGGPTRQQRGGGSRARQEDPNRPPEPDPVPKESKTLLKAADEKLGELPKWEFTRSPQLRLPTLGSRPISGDELLMLKTATTDERRKMMRDQDDLRLAERKQKREKQIEGEKNAKKRAEFMDAKPGEDEPKTFAEMQALLNEAPKIEQVAADAKKKANDKDIDEKVPRYYEPPPPGPIVFKAPKREQLAKVIAGLKDNPNAEVTEILRGIRRSVVSKTLIGPVLDEVLPAIGFLYAPQITTAFTNRLGELQKGAGISDEEIAKRIAERRAEVALLRQQAAKGQTQDQMEVDRGLREKAKQDMAVAQAKKDAATAKHRAIKKAAPKIKLAMDVDSRRTRLLGYVSQDVAGMVLRLKQKGDIRAMTIDRMVRDYTDAYKLADQQDQYQITSCAVDVKSAATTEQLHKSRAWLEAATKDLQKKKEDQKKIDDARVAELQEGVRVAGAAKSEAIRAWADHKQGKKRSEEEKALTRVWDALTRDAAEKAALSQLDAGRIALGVSNDFDVVSKIAAEVGAKRDRETIIANLRLNAVEVAILDAYMKPPIPGDDRALSGVIAGVRMRLQLALTPEFAPKIEKMILEIHDDNLKALDRIGAAQTPGFNATARAQKLHAALNSLDTDEATVYEQLDSLTKIQAQAIRLAYMAEYSGDTLEGDLKGGHFYGMSGNELRRAQKLLETDQATADAIGYTVALKGNTQFWSGLGVKVGDSEALDKINHGKTLEQRQAAEDAYNRENDPVLRTQWAAAKTDEERAALMKRYRASGKSQLLIDAGESLRTERQKERFAYSVAGDDDSADVLELRDNLPTPADVRAAKTASRYSTMDMSRLVVADRKKVEAIYDRIRREATARGDREHWTSDEIEGEIARRSQKIETMFNGRFAKDYETEGKSPLRAAFDVGFRHHKDEQNFANALADNDINRVDAAKVHFEHRGLWASDDVENAVLQSQYDRALAARRRDEMPLRRMVMARELAKLEKETRADARRKAKDAGKSDQEADQAAQQAWDGKKEWAQRERMQRDIDRTLEQAAEEQARGNMNGLRTAYRNDYGESLDDVVMSDTSGYDRDKAKILLERGRLTLGETMFYAVRGIGTDEAALDTLKGHTKAEIDVARAQFKVLAIKDAESPRGMLNKIWDGYAVDQTNMDTEILADVSGRTGFDVSQMLKGEPETIDAKRERLVEAISWENKAGPLGRSLGGDQMTALDMELARLDETIKKLEDPNLTAEQREIYLGFFEQDVATVDAGIAAHREVLDTWTDRITTAVGLVVGLLVTVATFGAAGLVLAAVLGSIFATASTIALKALIQGAAYGWEDLAVDIVVGIVDALTAAATAGMGEKLLGVVKNAAGPTASRFAFGKAVQRSLSAGGRLAVINPAEGVIARSIPTSALLREMVEKKGLARVVAMALAEGTELFVASTPSALASSLLDENNYKEGNPVGNILSGTIRQVGTGAAMGLGMKAGMKVGHWSLNVGGRMVDALRVPEAPALHHFDAAQRQFPGITYEEFTKLRAAATLEIRERESAVPERPSAAEERTRETGEAVREGGAAPRDAERIELPTEHTPGMLEATTPRDLTPGAAHDLLPPAIREHVAVTIDPHEAPGTVKVERVKRLGIIVAVKLVVGPNVRPIDIVMHGATVHAMQRYVGVSGAIVRTLERLRSFIVRDGFPPFGSKAWEAYHELNKLPAIIEQRLEMLRTGQLDPHAEATIHADLERLSRQVDEHRTTLDRMDVSPGVGYIAARGDPMPAAESSRPHERADMANPKHERYKAEYSTLERKYPKAEFLVVGAPWIEVKTTGKRVYRVLEIFDPVKKEIILRREEIQSLGANGKPVNRWGPRGQGINIIGEIGEEAFRIQFEAERAQGKRTGQILLPPEALKLPGGQGFDGVIVKFENGKATIILVEAKNYPGRYVPLEDITAINPSLKTNLENLREMVRDPVELKKLGLSADQGKLIHQAIDGNRLEFELHLGSDTKLGAVNSERSSVLRDLRGEISRRRQTSFPQDSVRALKIGERHMLAGEALVEARQRTGRKTEELRTLAKEGGRVVTEAGVRRAESVVTVQKRLTNVKEPLTAGQPPGTFHDANKKPLFVISEPNKSAKGLAEDVAKKMRELQPKTLEPTRLVVDVTDFTAAQYQTFRNELNALAKKTPAVKLERIIVVNREKRTAITFAKP